MPVQNVIAALTGGLIASALACIPGLHVYNLLGFALILAYGNSGTEALFFPFSLGMIAGFAVCTTIPSVILAAPDESSMFTVLPGQKYLMKGRAYEAVILTAAGSAAGVGLVIAGLAGFGPAVLPVMRQVFAAHSHWIIWCVICFMLMSEWPRDTAVGLSGWRRFFKAWQQLFAGLATFVMSGLLGFALFYSSPVPAGSAFQNLMPAFVGLFTMPWLLLNLVSGCRAPRQRLTLPGIHLRDFVAGSIAGTLGGGFAAFFPVITGGVGGFLAGHAVSIRNDRMFLVSQGASKAVYYSAAVLLLFVPGLNMARGGGALMINALCAGYSYEDFYRALGFVAMASAAALLLVAPLAILTLRAMQIAGLRMLSAFSLLAALCVVFVGTGTVGIGIMSVGLGIGLVPPLFGTRRMNCLGIILLPVACMMSGIGDDIAAFLRLAR